MTMNTVFTVTPSPTLIAGVGSLDQLAAQVSALGEQVILVADAGLARLGLLDAVRERFAEGMVVGEFLVPAGEPAAATVDACADAVRAVGPAVVVGVGGGTALDIAKLAACLAAMGGPVSAHMLGRSPMDRRWPAVMIPTTAGTGAEVTRTCVLADAAGSKVWAWGPGLLPDAVILEPALTRGLPRGLTVATGLDAFVHALEAVTGQARQPVLEASGLQAIRLLAGSLHTAVAQGDDLDARGRVQLAACLAGVAIDAGGTGVAHNIGHALGTVYHLPHGLAVALALRATLAWSVAADPERYTPAARAFDPSLCGADLPAAYGRWLDSLGFPAVVAASGVTALDAKALVPVMNATENLPMARNNARPVTAADMAELARLTVAAWAACLAGEVAA